MFSIDSDFGENVLSAFKLFAQKDMPYKKGDQVIVSFRNLKLIIKREFLILENGYFHLKDELVKMIENDGGFCLSHRNGAIPYIPGEITSLCYEGAYGVKFPSYVQAPGVERVDSESACMISPTMMVHKRFLSSIMEQFPNYRFSQEEDFTMPKISVSFQSLINGV